MRSGAVPQAPQFRPTTQVQNSQPTGTANKSTASNGEVKSEVKSPKVGDPAAKTAGAPEKSSINGSMKDPLGDARGKVQEEISAEFAAIMAQGTLRASEAAALATRRVMQRYGHANVALS